MFADLEDNDLIVPATSAAGMDLVLSPKAANLFPYAVECKRTEGLAQDYKFMKQAEDNSNGLTPLVIMRSNHKEALVMLKLADFEKLIGERK